MRTLSLLSLLVLAGCGGVEHTPWDTSNATKQLPVVLVSMATDLSPEVNRSHLQQRVEGAVAEHPDVRLIVFGETSLGWYFKSFDPTYQRTVAEPLEGTTVTLMKRLALTHQVAIAFGFSELADGKVFNSAVIIDAQGEVIAHRRKTNFVPMDESSGFTRGEKTVTTAFIDGIKVAFLICNDFNDQDYQAQIRADPEIKLVVLPHASAGLESKATKTAPFPFKGAWMLAAQRVGKENGDDTYHGSWILDPNGYLAADSESAEGFLYQVISVNALAD
jgi:predicted amidohydrolase